MQRYLEASKSRVEETIRWFRRGLSSSFAITRQGALYLTLIVLLAIAAVLTGNNLLFMMVATLISAIAVSGIVSRNSLRQVSLSLQAPDNVFVGERIPIKVSMTNLKRVFPSFSILVEDPDRRRGMFDMFRRGSAADEDAADRNILQQAAYFPILRAGETRSELSMQSFPRRGAYRLNGFWLSTHYPFGFFRRGERIDAEGEVIVYPSIQDISSFFHLLPFLPGHLEGVHAGPGESLFSIRSYRESDSARRIEWNATAKTGELMVREYARDEESRFCLILDTWMHASGSDAAFERGVSLAAGIAAHFLKAGAGMEFMTPFEFAPWAAGVDQLYRILRVLATVRCEAAPEGALLEFAGDACFPVLQQNRGLSKVFSDKTYKIILTSRPRGSFSSEVWRSSHVVFFEEL